MILSDAHRTDHPLGNAHESAPEQAPLLAHSHSHPHPHFHAHGEGKPHPARVPASLLRLSAAVRLAFAGVLVALLWAGTFWVVS